MEGDKCDSALRDKGFRRAKEATRDSKAYNRTLQVKSELICSLCPEAELPTESESDKDAPIISSISEWKDPHPIRKKVSKCELKSLRRRNSKAKKSAIYGRTEMIACSL